MSWPLNAAQTLCDRLRAVTASVLPDEILKLDDRTAGIVVDIDGVDYILTMTEVPKQRPRPSNDAGAFGIAPRSTTLTERE